LGSTYTVEAWQPDTRFGEPDGYRYNEICATQSLIKALWALWRHRRAGGCVRLEMRL